MADRDYKVVYRARPVDRDENYDRRRMPTALDPYEYPEDRMELKRNVAEAKIRAHGTRRDYDLEASDELCPDDSISQQDFPSSAHLSRTAGSTPTGRETVEVKSATGVNGATTKTTYSVKRDISGGDAYVAGATKSITNAPTPPPLQHSKTATVVQVKDRERDLGRRDLTPPALVRYETAPSREYIPMEYDVEPLPKQNGAYVIETRRGNDVDVYIAGRDQDKRRYKDDDLFVERIDDNRGRRTPTTVPRNGKKYYKEIRRDRVSRSPGDPRSSISTVEVVSDRNGAYASGAIFDDSRGTYSVKEPRTPTKASRIDEDDWKVIDSNPSSSSQLSAFRDPFHDNLPIDKRGRTRGRSFATQSSEDDYVFVSPVQKTKTVTTGGPKSVRTNGALRSVLVREDTYTPEEKLHRRRSRSAHFRDRDIPHHSIGEMKHERPGEEAMTCGRYLKHYDDFDERSNRGYRDADYERKTTVIRDRSFDRGSRSAAPSSRYAPQDYGVSSSEVSRYPPQRGYSASRHDRERDDGGSRRHRHRRHHERRGDEEDDNESYYSQRIEQKKETRYI